MPSLEESKCLPPFSQDPASPTTNPGFSPPLPGFPQGLEPVFQSMELITHAKSMEARGLWGWEKVYSSQASNDTKSKCYDMTWAYEPIIVCRSDHHICYDETGIWSFEKFHCSLIIHLHSFPIKNTSPQKSRRSGDCAYCTKCVYWNLFHEPFHLVLQRHKSLS